MKKLELAKFMACLDLKPAPVHREGWVVSSCPLAPFTHQNGTDKHPSFGFRIEPGESFTHCFSCQFHGKQSELVQTLGAYVRGTDHGLDLKGAMAMVLQAEQDAPLSFGDIGDDIETMLDSDRVDHVFPEWWIDNFDPAYCDGYLHPYLLKRTGGPFPYPVVEALDLRFDAYQHRIGFPVRDFKGRLRGFHGRSVKSPPDEPTYRMYTHENMNNPEVWLGEHWVDLDRPVVMVESVFDLARVRQVYDNVVCPLTASLSTQKIKRMAAVEIVTFFDNDKAGKLAADKIRATLKDSVITKVKYDPHDPKDPGDMTAHRVAELLDDLVTIEFILD
jgi:5S rRNA maturation endonuclease (ribonuclease M5)